MRDPLARVAAFVDILRCADGSDDVGSAHGDSLDKRLGEHHAGMSPGYTSRRRPVVPVHTAEFEWISDAAAFECWLKGWSRAKKEALIAGDCDAPQRLAKRPHRAGIPEPSTSF